MTSIGARKGYDYSGKESTWMSRARVTMAMPKLIIATYRGINDALTSLLKGLEKPCIKKKVDFGVDFL